MKGAAPLLRGPRAFVFLDGSADGDLEAQETILRNLKKCQVPVGAMIRTLMKMEVRRLLVMEQRAAGRDRRHDHAERVYALLEQALSLVPPETSLEQAAYTAVSEAESVCLKRDRTERLVRRRRQLENRIASGAQLSAIQQRFMPEVRRVVCTIISRALQQREGVHDVRVGTKVYRDQDDAAADALSAKFIRVFFPTWGATTTPELVRKARKVSAPLR